MYSSVLEISNRLLAARDVVEGSADAGYTELGCEQALEAFDELLDLVDRLATEVPMRSDEEGNPLDF